MKQVESEERAIVRLHEARDTQQLAQATFALFDLKIPNEYLFIAFRPLEFELPAIASKAKYQPSSDRYIGGNHNCDIWLKRSPIHPAVRVVRHSDYTPLDVLKKSEFYKRVMENIGSEYGASMVAWRGSTWLATLTVFRGLGQGDLSDREMKIMFRWQMHFESAVRKIANVKEAGLGNSSLEAFVWGLPTAAIILDWNMRVLHYNAAAEELCTLWHFGNDARHTKKSRTFRVPGDLLAAIEQRRHIVNAAKPNRPTAPKLHSLFSLNHSCLAELEANVSFLPSKSLTVSKGTFLVELSRKQPVVNRQDSYKKLCVLTQREREVVRLAATGKKSTEIGNLLGTSSITVRSQLHSIYQKLNIKTRFELISTFNEFDQITQANLQTIK